MSIVSLHIFSLFYAADRQTVRFGGCRAEVRAQSAQVDVLRIFLVDRPEGYRLRPVFRLVGVRFALGHAEVPGVQGGESVQVVVQRVVGGGCLLHEFRGVAASEEFEPVVLRG